MECGGEKVIAFLSSVGKVTKASCTPKRAKGVFIPPVGLSPRRSPCLLAKRRKIMTSSSSIYGGNRYTDLQLLRRYYTNEKCHLEKGRNCMKCTRTWGGSKSYESGLHFLGSHHSRV